MEAVGYAPRAGRVRGPVDGAVALGVLFVLVSSLTVTAGVAGGVVGLALGVGWLFVPTVYVLAVGHAALLAVLSADPTWVTVGIVEGGFFALVLGEVVFDDSARPAVPAVALGGGFVSVLGTTAVALAASGSYAVAAAVATVVTGAVVYGLHRYELAVLDPTREPDDQRGGPDRRSETGERR